MTGLQRLFHRVPERGLALLLLLAVVTVWGGTFALVKAAFADISPLLFNLLRFVLAAVLLLAINAPRLRLTRATFQGGALSGCLLALGYELQTMGLARTSAIHSAFITGLVVIFVPLLSLVPRFRAKEQHGPGWSALIGCLAAFIGLFLLTTPSGTAARDVFTSMHAGDLLTLGCALAFAAHLLSLSRLAHLPATTLVPLQITVCATAMAICLPLDRAAKFQATPRLGVALLITSVFATAVAFFVQTWAQQHLPATTTALVLTLEPVVALVASVLFLGEQLSIRAAVGSGLILVGIVATEILSPTSPVPFEPG